PVSWRTRWISGAMRSTCWRSNGRTRCSAPPSCDAVSPRRASSRPTSTTRAPSCANAIAAARPSPDEAPVTTIPRPSNPLDGGASGIRTHVVKIGAPATHLADALDGIAHADREQMGVADAALPHEAATPHLGVEDREPAPTNRFRGEGIRAHDPARALRVDH